jgi:cobalt/nickel transport system permease protein
VKVIFTFAFLLFLNLTPYRAWPAYILFFSLVLSVALISRFSVGFMMGRGLFVLPFIFAAAPIVFTGSHLNSLTFLDGFHISYSQEGLERFFSIAVKAWICVQASILLAATTRFPDLLNAFQQLKVPKLFIAIIGLMWRYLFVMADEVTRMLRARSSRSAFPSKSGRAGGSLFWRARVTGGMAGSLFLRSIERSERIYAAMLSRGYDGDLPNWDSPAMTLRERGVLATGFFLLVLLWVLGLLSGG